MKKEELRDKLYHIYCSAWLAGFKNARGYYPSSDKLARVFRRAYLRISRELELKKEVGG